MQRMDYRADFHFDSITTTFEITFLKNQLIGGADTLKTKNGIFDLCLDFFTFVWTF